MKVHGDPFQQTVTIAVTVRSRLGFGQGSVIRQCDMVFEEV